MQKNCMAVVAVIKRKLCRNPSKSMVLLRIRDPEPDMGNSLISLPRYTSLALTLNEFGS